MNIHIYMTESPHFSAATITILLKTKLVQQCVHIDPKLPDYPFSLFSPLGKHKPVIIVPTDGHEFEQGPGDSDGQGSLPYCSPWGCKESDTTERLN